MHLEAFEKLTQQLEETRTRVAMNEGLLKELAATCDSMHDLFDRKIKGVFYQLENPEFKQKLNAYEPA